MGRNFDTISKAPAKPSCDFDLGGRKWFCRPASRVPYNVIRDMAVQQVADPDNPEPDEVRAVYLQMDELMAGVLMEDQVDDFFEMVNGKNSPLTSEVMNQLIPYITEHVLSRPTKRSSSSSAGSRAKRGASRGGSSSPATQRARTA